MTDREVMQMALDVVQRYSKETPLGNQPHMIAQVAYECIEALRTALAKPSWEPVAWMNGYKAGYAQAQETDLAIPTPKKEWVGLTDDEIRAILDCGRGGVVDIKKAEQKLKDKNI